MLWTLFFTFFKIGLFTFGGGYAMIAQMKEVIVQEKGWLNDDELLEVITIAESTPGPIAINLATYVGYKRGGFLGSACCTAGVVLPSLIILYTISLFLDAFMANKYVAYAFVGIKCAVAFLILKAGYGMFAKLPRNALTLSVFAVVFALLLVFEVFSISFSAIFFILVGGAIGITAYALIGGKEAKK